MRHAVNQRKFGRVKKQREALMRSLALSLITHGKIETTLAKAKSLRPFVEKMVTRARNASLNDRRVLLSRLQDEVAVKKLIEDVAPQFEKRDGGYTRVVKLSPRSSDASPMAIIEFVK